jgi:hypothetical protein
MEDAMHRQVTNATLLVAAVGLCACGAGSPRSSGDSATGHVPQAISAGQCQLPGAIQHVIYIQFDNVHFRRDNPNVPSDLEQMPHLLNFITGGGTLLSNHHTPLISHTADDIVTSLTGVYPARHGEAVANSYVFFTPPGSKFFDGFASSFTYWTDPVNTSTDTSFNVITPDGKNAPAPWVPYTRAGCNVGAVSTANIELENISGDLRTVFGPNSPEVAEAIANPRQAVADFEGIAVHCAAGDSVCSSQNGGVADLLPSEPGAYTGYSGLFGHKFVAPVISPDAPLTDLDGNPITGFPGFGGIRAAQTLAYVAAMQEHGMPVTFGYISDAHDDHVNDVAFGPGEAGYVAQLAAYDRAFDAFFTRLAADGITKDNTLFVITADENDHFAGGPPTPADCDGVNVPCTYAKIGEIDANITSLLGKVDPSLAATPFAIHFDMAPAFYIQGNQAPGTPVARAYERAAAKLTAVSPITGNTDNLTLALADAAELQLLHMVTGDPQRTPSFVMFGDPDYFFLTSGADVAENPGFAWNHGGINPEITTTWLGLVGPGVKNAGVTGEIFSDHTDIRPTILSLVGLTDDYVSDGRVLFEVLQTRALPQPLNSDPVAFELLAAAYKAINAPLGPLAKASLRISTAGLASGDATNDAKYQTAVAFLANVTTVRDALAQKMITALDAAEFHGVPLDGRKALAWTAEAAALVAVVEAVAATF